MAIQGGSGNASSILKSVRVGASIWTTFRFVSQVIYAICWITALPVELVLNRKMGRRYTGLLPVTLAFLLLVLVLAASGIRQGPFVRAGLAPSPHGFDFVPPLVMLLAFLALTRHRLAAWWRFRSDEQVYSFSDGVPFWLNPPQMLTRVFPKPAATSEPVDQVAASDSQPASSRGESVFALVEEFFSFLGSQVPPLVRQWRSGEVPTGPIKWFLATVIHPLLIAVAAFPVIMTRPILGLYLWYAAFAIFLKARIQKALVVETVYDLFDGRIEQQFTRSLAEPRQLRAVEATGFVVPGLARTLAGVAPPTDSPAPIAAEFGALMDGHKPEIVVKQMSAPGPISGPHNKGGHAGVAAS